MKEKNTERVAESRVAWNNLETFARLEIQGWVQRLMEEENNELLGREKSERRAAVDAAAGYRNGYGKPRKLACQQDAEIQFMARARASRD